MFKKLGRGWVAVLCSLALLGTGAVMVPPAASALSGINWSKAWKHEIQPRADKRYYTKAGEEEVRAVPQGDPWHVRRRGRRLSGE